MDHFRSYIKDTFLAVIPEEDKQKILNRIQKHNIDPKDLTSHKLRVILKECNLREHYECINALLYDLKGQDRNVDPEKINHLIEAYQRFLPHLDKCMRLNDITRFLLIHLGYTEYLHLAKNRSKNNRQRNIEFVVDSYRNFVKQCEKEKIIVLRNFHDSRLGPIDPTETPDGCNCGLVKKFQSKL